MDKNEELRNLQQSAIERMNKAHEDYIRICQEESQKLEDFFLDNKKEIAIPIDLFDTKAKQYGIWKSKTDLDNLLTRDVSLSGYKKDGFYISDKFGNRIKLTDEVIEKIQFLDDCSKDLFNEVSQGFKETTNEAYNNLILNGTYAVIIYPEKPGYHYESNTTIQKLLDKGVTFCIYIGKIIFGKSFYNTERTAEMRHSDGARTHFTIHPEALFDAVVFDNSSDFNDYVSRHGYHNEMKLSEAEIKKLPTK